VHHVGMDNREAMAYMLFRRFNCSRVEALGAVEELAQQFSGIARIAVRRWRSRRTKKTVDPRPFQQDPHQ